MGVGTGSTVNLFIEALIVTGKRLGGVVTTSKQSEELLRKGGFNPMPLTETKKPLDIYVDGADEVGAPRGGGGRSRDGLETLASVGESGGSTTEGRDGDGGGESVVFRRRVLP